MKTKPYAFINTSDTDMKFSEHYCDVTELSYDNIVTNHIYSSSDLAVI
ncbi:MAG: hypothetical protein ACK521_00005 [bacterium]|jgi:hypothetical protein